MAFPPSAIVRSARRRARAFHQTDRHYAHRAADEEPKQGDRMSRAGKHALIEQLIADGVRYVFGNPGTTEQPFMDALQDHPELEFILCLHEGVAVSVADAYARATGKPAFVQLHIAPGLGNAIWVFFNAMGPHSPLVVCAGRRVTEPRFPAPR